MKKLLLLLTLCLCSIAVWAQNYDFSAVAPSGQTLYYKIDGSNAIVTYPVYYSDASLKPVGDVVIPESVTDAASGNSYTVTAIDEYAFYNDSLLTSIAYPSTMTEIRNRAFYHCTGLSSLTLQSWLSLVGDAAFEGCTGLSSLAYYPANCTVGTSLSPAFSGCSNLSDFTFGDEVTAIPDDFFAGCSGLTSISLPNRITSIGYGAFKNCTGLTSITIPDSVTYVGNYAFWGCSNLSSLNYNAINCTYLGHTNQPAFYQCNNITTITIGENVSSIPANGFKGCSGVTTVNFNATNCASLGSYSNPPFATMGSIEHFNIGENVTRIPDNLFSGCSWIDSVVIPNSVTAIGHYAFYGCSSLEDIMLPDKLKSIGNYAFAGCTSLPSINFPDSLESINIYAFLNCSSLARIDNLGSLTFLGGYAFQNCSSLDSLEIPNTLTFIGGGAFEGCTGLSYVNYLGSLEEWCGMKLSGSYANPAELTHNLWFNGIEMDSAVVIPSTTTTIRNYVFAGCTNLTSVSLPNSVTAIGEGSFKGCTALTSIDLPQGLNAIRNAAFSGCTSLTGIDLSMTLDTIGDNAFYGCTSITSITIPDSVLYIGNNAFSDCSGLTSVNYNAINCNKMSTSSTSSNSVFSGCDNFTKLTIGNKVTNIPYYAFQYCSSITSIVIPNSVTRIGSRAFYNCTSVASVVLGSGLTSTASTTISSNAFDRCANLETVYNLTNLNILKTNCGKVAYNAKRIIKPTKFGTGENTLYRIDSTYSFVDTEDDVETNIPRSTIPTNFIYKDGGSWKAKEVVLTDDTSRFCAPTAFTADTVSYTRELASEGTLYLPFSAAAPSDIEVYDLASFANNTVSFSEHDGDIAAYTPYLVASPSFTISAANVTFPKSESANYNTVTKNDMTFQGVIERTQLSNTNYTYDNGTFVQSDGSANVNPFHCYLTAEGVLPASTLTVELASVKTLEPIIAEAVAGKTIGQTATITLDSSVTYSLSDTADAGLVSIIINGNGALVNLTGAGQIAGQQGITINNVNFDCADNTVAPIALSATPDESLRGSNFQTEGTALRGNAYYDTCAIVINGCNFREVKTPLVSASKHGWNLKGLTITSTIAQFNTDGTGLQAYIDWYGNSSNEGSIKDIVIENSTLYNIVENNTAYFLRLQNSSNSQAQKAWALPQFDGKESWTMTSNTFVNLPSNKNFASNYPNKDNIALDFKKNVYYNTSKLQKISSAAARNFTVADNAIIGITTTVDATDAAYYATIDSLLIQGDGRFVVPTTALDFANLDLTDNFAPDPASYAGAHRFGDPRWLPARTLATITANVNDATMGSVTGAGEYAIGENDTLTAIANIGYAFTHWTNANGDTVSTSDPWILAVAGDTTVTANFVADADATPLCFTANTAGSEVSLTKSGSPADIYLETSTDGLTWTDYTIGTSILLPNAGDKIYFRKSTDGVATSFSTSTNYYYKFVMSGSIAASGNVMSLVDKYYLTKTIPCNWCFSNLFYDCTALTTAPQLPATTLDTLCYNYMFFRCSSLTAAPELPATTLANNCYMNMFMNCTSLTDIPGLPATTLANSCYQSMFSACYALTTPPELPATTLDTSCYQYMFQACTTLTVLPQLPATTLADNCYKRMFNYCTALKVNTTGPGVEWSIPAEATGATNAATEMFMNTSGDFTGAPTPGTTYYLYSALPIATVTASVNDTTMGGVAVAGSHIIGTNDTLTATAKIGYAFTHWTNANGDSITNANPWILAVAGDTTVTANFEIITHTVALAANDATFGTVAGAGTYNYGTQVTLTATPAAHYHFVAWSNGATDNPFVFTLVQDTNLTAIFEIDTHTVALAANDATFGTVNGAGTYNYGTQVTLTATPAAHYHFVAWSNGATDNPLVFTLVQDTNLTAIFEIDTHTVALAANDATFGTVNGAGTYNYGTQVTLTATPAAHYHFVAWNNGATDNPLVFTLVQDTNLTAIFEIDTHTVVLAANDATFGTVAGAGTYNYGTQVTLTATPAAHYHFVAWSNGATDNPLVFTLVQDTNLTAIFEIDTHTITGAANNNALGFVTGSATVAYGTPVTLQATPTIDNLFVAWSNGETTPAITIVADQDSVLTAYFVPQISIDPVVIDPETGDTLSFFQVSPDGYCQNEYGNITFSILAGQADQYKIDFADEDFADVDWTDLDDNNITIFVPAGATDGVKSAKVKFRTIVTLPSGDEAYAESDYLDFVFVVNLSNNNIRVVFDDVLTIDNSGNTYNTYQWYRNGEPIVGATKGYYQEVGGLNGDNYYVCVNPGTDSALRTCIFTAPVSAPTTKSVAVYPNIISTTATIVIRGFEATSHTLRIYNDYGVEVLSKTFDGFELKADFSNLPQGSFIVWVDGVSAKVIKH